MATAFAGGEANGDADVLAVLADRLAADVETISAAWAQRLVLHLGDAAPKRSHPVEAIAWLNTWYLEDHLSRLRQGRVDTMLRESFQRHLRLLRSQRSAPPQERLTLAQLYKSLEIASSLFSEWARKLFADDPRLPDMLAAIGRLSLRLGETVSQAFHEVRAEELKEALRVSSALLDTSLELNTRSASVSGVLSHLATMIARHLGCERTLAFVWLPNEGAYAPADGYGLEPDETDQLRKARFRPGEHPITELLLRGESVCGHRDDGRVNREMMERYGSHTYAVAPIVGSQREPLGLLAGYRSEPRPFAPVDLRILEGMARNAALALENARLVEQLEAAARLKGEFINSMSHEMRTPLNVIFGYLEMLSDQIDHQPEGQVFIDRIQRHAGYLVKLVNTLLDVGRIDAGHMPINVETFTVDAVLEDLEHLFGPLARDRGLRFECSAAGKLPPLTTDRLKLLEILNNLLSNAFKFTDAGCIGVRALGDEDRVRFEVVDTGIGIDPGSAPAAFDLFRQLGTSDRGGAGLGLYVVKRLTQLLNGEVCVESAPGRGSCFRVEIPRVLAA